MAACGDDATPDGGHGDAGGRDASIDTSPDDARDASDRDAMTTDAAMSDAGPDVVVHEVAPAFFAQGYSGRRLRSCDDGHTWTAETSFEQEAIPLLCGAEQEFRCYDEASTCQYIRNDECQSRTNCDCDHHPGNAQGMAFGADHLVANFGWGTPGTVLRTTGGSDWSTVYEGSTFGGVLYGAGRFVLASRRPLISTDDGATFEEGAMATFESPQGSASNVRSVGFADVMGGRMMMLASDSGVSAMAISSDGGDSWWNPSTWPEGCGAVLSGIGGIGEYLVAVGQEAICYSEDGGENWRLSAAPEASFSTALFIGDEVHAYTRDGNRHVSTDMETWTSDAVEPARAFFGAMARSAAGTLVAVNGGWQQWYERQRFYRSDDGIHWTELDEDSALRGHRIKHMTYGTSEDCR